LDATDSPLSVQSWIDCRNSATSLASIRGTGGVMMPLADVNSVREPEEISDPNRPSGKKIAKDYAKFVCELLTEQTRIYGKR